MDLFGGLEQLGKLIAHIESSEIKQARLIVLSYENRESIARHLIDGLVDSSCKNRIRTETSAGEYLNQMAILEINNNKYIVSRDHQQVYISALNDFSCRITPGSCGILVYHLDYPGVIYDVSRILAQHQINISSMNVSREQKGKSALLVSLTDEEIPPSILSLIASLPQVTRVICLQ